MGRTILALRHLKAIVSLLSRRLNLKHRRQWLWNLLPMSIHPTPMLPMPMHRIPILTMGTRIRPITMQGRACIWVCHSLGLTLGSAGMAGILDTNATQT
jgi:hypothetical protein